MTRHSVNRALSQLYGLLAILLLVMLAGKFADEVPGLPPVAASAADRLYAVLRDGSLLIVAGVAAYMANVFQKRAKFVETLKDEWRHIVRTKSVLLSTCEKPYLATDDYLAACYSLNEALDMMHSVYRNVGETDGLEGLYPYEPLHDMRRALETLDPRLATDVTGAQKASARAAILEAFNALKEAFLEELDLEEPAHPLLIEGARRLKSPGADVAALLRQDHQRHRLKDKGEPQAKPDIDSILATLRAEESDSTGRSTGADEPKPPDR
jgi:hypothetical protein